VTRAEALNFLRLAGKGTPIKWLDGAGHERAGTFSFIAPLAYTRDEPILVVQEDQRPMARGLSKLVEVSGVKVLE